MGKSLLSKLVADWLPGSPAYIAVDYDNGSDANPGFSTESMLLAGAAPIRTLEELYRRIPPHGAGRSLAIGIKPRAGGAAYRNKANTANDTLILDGVDSYVNLVARATADFLNDSNDQRVLGGQPVPGTEAGGYNIQRISVNVTAASNAAPIQITTATAHGLSTGDIVMIEGVTGNTAAIGKWTVTRVDEVNFTLTGSRGDGAWAGGGTVVTYKATVAGTLKNVTGATNVAPIEITAVGHGRINGDTVVVLEVTGNTAANGNWVITFVDADHYTLNGSAGNGAYAGGGTAGKAAAFATAGDAIYGKRLRWDAATTSAALRNTGQGVWQNTAICVLPMMDFAALPVTTDVVYVEQPQLVIGAVQARGGRNQNLSFAGIKTTGNWALQDVTNVQMAFCESGGVASLSQIGTVGLSSGAWRTESGATVFPVGANLAVFGGLLSASNVTGATLREIYGSGGLFVANLLGSISVGGGSFYRDKVSFRVCGTVAALVVTPGASSQGVGNQNTATERRLLVSPSVPNVSLVLVQSPLNIYGVQLINSSIGQAVFIKGDGFAITVDDAVGSEGNVFGGLLTDDCRNVKVSVAFNAPVTLRDPAGLVGDFYIGHAFGSDGMFWPDLDLTYYEDDQGNVITGKAGNSGGAFGIYSGNGAGGGFAVTEKFWVVRLVDVTNNTPVTGCLGRTTPAQADTAADATGLVGIALARDSTSQLAFIVRHTGYAPIEFDAASLGGLAINQIAYLSTSEAGKAQNFTPAVAGTNQKYRLGIIRKISSPYCVVELNLDPFAVPADGNP